MTKGVQEFEIKFFQAYVDALLNQNFIIRTIEVENNHLPQTITIDNEGESKNYRMIPFKRSNDRGNYLENVYVYIH